MTGYLYSKARQLVASCLVGSIRIHQLKAMYGSCDSLEACKQGKQIQIQKDYCSDDKLLLFYDEGAFLTQKNLSTTV